MRSDNTVAWMRDGEAELRARLAPTPDLAARSLLPGWTRGHVVAHLVGNAVALANLVTWARTGVETPMYTDADARAAQIEADSTVPAPVLVERLRQSGDDLVAGYLALDEAQLDASVRTAQGRTRQAREVAWMRARESWVHLVDLDVGFRLAQAPPAFVDALLADAAATVAARGTPVDPASVRGPVAEVTSWLIGRPHRLPEQSLPPLPAWL